MDEDLRLQVEANTRRVNSFEARMESLETELAANTAATQQVKENTDVLVEITQAFRGLAKVLAWCGRAFKPVATIGAAIASAYFAWKQSK